MTDLLDNTRVRLKNNQLTLAGMFSAPKPLIPVGKNLFRNEKDPEATVAFFPNASAQMCFAPAGGTSHAERINPIWPYLRLLPLALFGLLLSSPLLHAVFRILPL